LEIAGAELLTNCCENYEDQQKTWQKEVNEKLQTCANNSTRRYEFERDLIRKRQEEWKHAKDVRLIYERKLERTNNLYLELSACFMQLEEREREIAEKERQIGTNKPYRKQLYKHFDKQLRRKFYMQTNSTANELNSPSSPSPPTSPNKASMCVQIDGSGTKTVIQQSSIQQNSSKYIPRKRTHRRTGSGSSYTKTLPPGPKLVDMETQTEDIEKINDEINEAPVTASIPRKHSKAHLQSTSESSSGETDIDDHAPQEDTTSSSQTNALAMVNSMATSVMTGSNFSYDDSCAKDGSDDDLENLRLKVSSLITDTSNSTTSSASTIVNKVVNKAYSTRNGDISVAVDDNIDKNCNNLQTTDSTVNDDKEIVTDHVPTTKDINLSFLRRKR
jgi:mitogen-activated protein kinase kinase kinase 13